MKNIALDIKHYCLTNKREQFKESEVVYILTDLELMKVIKLSRGKRSDVFYNSWGIDLEEYAHTLRLTLPQGIN
jgi:hypothetical protein